MAAWTYDVRSRKFRSVSVNSTGKVATGTAWHDEKTDTWHGRVTSQGQSGTMLWKGRIRVIDRNTKEEHCSAYTMAGLVKTVEMSKT